MDKQHTTSKRGDSGRRKFLVKAALAGIGAPVLSYAASEAAPTKEAVTEKTEKKWFSLFKKYYNKIDDQYEIASNYERMDQKNTVFSRTAWDSPIGLPEGQFISFSAKSGGQVPNPLEQIPGFGPLEHALDGAAFALHDVGTPLSIAGVHNKGVLNDWDTLTNPKTLHKHHFASPEEAAKYVKRASRFLGADEVGIAPYDERWTYSKWYDVEPAMNQEGEGIHEEARFPFKPKSVIAVSFEMDYDALKTPGYIGAASVQMEYSAMAEVTFRIAVFLNKLGYKAIPAGNDVGISIPIAAQAGLGELSRMGTLISEKYGSRVRLAKVYTDLEIAPDKPVGFGVWEFCLKCKKCAEACPSDAISMDNPTEAPTVPSISSHPGVKKWYQDNEKCMSQWEKLGMGCNVCLVVCPYNKIDNWLHDLSKLVVSAPVGRDVARQLDDAFGYGKFKEESIQEFWDKED